MTSDVATQKIIKITQNNYPSQEINVVYNKTQDYKDRIKWNNAIAFAVAIARSIETIR